MHAYLRKNFLCAGLIILAIILSPAFSQIAQTGNKGLLRTHSAQTLGKGFLGVNAAAYFSFDDEFVEKTIEIDDLNRTAILASGSQGPTYVSTYYNLSYGLLSFWDIALGLPVYVDNTGVGEASSETGIGDMTFAMKIQYPPYEHSHVFDMSYFGQFFIPMAKENKGLFPRQPYYTQAQNIKEGTRFVTRNLINDLDSLDNASPDDLYNSIDSAVAHDSLPIETYYYGAGNLSFLAKMLWTFDASQINPDVAFKWHFNFGALFTGKSTTDNIFELGSALEWSPHPVITIFTDFYGQARFTQLAAGFDLGKEPMILGSGVCINIPGGAHITVAFDKSFSLSTKYKNIYYNEAKQQVYQTKIFPDYGLSVSANWCGSVLGGDSDKDGLPDKIDRCPNEPEDVDNFEDQDGCPDNDNDKDGILDIRDKCPNKPEDFDNFDDNDGCPDIDNDKDGIPDMRDKCPNDPEDRDGFEDTDGCPDLDNDKDGILDSLDRCPIDAEDVDGFQDDDGCPDVDNDQDGIPDAKDKCPMKKENFNSFQDDDGCPDTKAPEIKPRVILEGVNFKTGSAELTYESGSVLDQVVESLTAYPKVCIEIRGYTDSRGKRSRNQRLSADRAASVKNYLMSKGVEAGRIRSAGYGESNPIASNKSAEGRARNRRIEMYRIKCR